MRIAQTLPAGGFSRPVPLTVVGAPDSNLAFRRAATRADVVRALHSRETRDMLTFDQESMDAAGVFLVGELERLDQRLHMPLVDVTWSRDIDLRTDVSIADEQTSFTNSQFGSIQGVPGSNKAWVGKTATAIPNVALDIGKTIQPLNLWAMQIDWTLAELASAQKLGRPVDTQKFEFMQLKHQMDIDEQVYVGDAGLSMNGLLNHSSLSNTGNAVNGSWATATPAQILQDINSLLTSVWTATGFAIIPDELRLDPTSYSILVSTLISSAGNISILEFVLANNLARANGKQLKVQPVKWLLGTGNGNTLGVASTNSMFAYVKQENRVRFPYVALQRTPVEYRDIRQIVTYYGRLGAVEMVYPEVCGRRSNLG